MARVDRGRTWAILLVWLVCLLSAFAACGGDDGGGVAQGKGGGGGGGKGGGSGSGGLNVDGSLSDLKVDPPTATLTVTDKTTKLTQQFTALSNGSAVTAKWTLSSYDIASIDSSGLASSGGIVAGKVTVTADYAGKTANAELIINVKLSEDVDANVNPTDKTALGGAPSADPGPDPSKFLYPYDQTVLPKGLVAPLLMVSAGSLPPSSAKVHLSTPEFSWDGFYTVADPSKPRFTVPQDIWDAAMISAAGKNLGVEVTKASSGTAYGPYAIQVVAANGSLKGVVYYQTYEEPQNGIWAVRPGNVQAATQVKAGCVVCHSVSANGTMLSTGAEVNVQSTESGVYQVDLAGNATQISQSPSTLGGDTRGLSFGAWTPDGKYVLRSQNDFWGGVNQMAWKVDVAGGKLDAANVVGMGTAVAAYLPAFAPNGKKLVFTQANGEASPQSAPSRSIHVMDVAVDEANGPAGTLTFSNRVVALDNGASGRVAKFATFLPDSQTIALCESNNYESAYSSMLPSYYNGAYGGADGRLWAIEAVASSPHVELVRANSGNVPADQDHNYEPFALPVPAGGYYWVVFTSIREYGNMYQGGEVRKQLWVAAITPGGLAAGDPSHPAFFLPNQTGTKNERGFWALDPCKPKGDSCQTGDECCDGFCRPSNPDDPSSPKICGEGSGCSQASEKCTTDADCCTAATALKCLGGFCTPKVQ